MVEASGIVGERIAAGRARMRILWASHLAAMEGRKFSAARRIEREIFGIRCETMPQDVKELLSAPYHVAWRPDGTRAWRLSVYENPARARAREMAQAKRREAAMRKATKRRATR